CVGAASFGPRESMLIFDGRKNSSSYRLDNTDTHLPWLVQAWVEDVNEKRTDVFTSVPLVFRVEPSSTFTVRIVKKSAVPEDRETLYWAVSNSLPGGERSEQKAEDDKISAQLSLAYRFKVPMIYRPAALAGKPQQPESLQWHADKGGKMTVHNPTRYVVQLNYVNAGGKRYQGKGVSWFISPEKSV
ncbi:TPA: molecular chaperone, partial [Escherichia coli]